MFNAGAGTVHNGGDVEASYNSFTEQLMRLPYNTRIFPSHDYIVSNLKFTLAREPGNAAAAALLPTVASHDPASFVVATLKDEKEPNTLMRLRNPSFIYQLRESFPDLPAEPDAKTVFKKLRKLRNAC